MYQITQAKSLQFIRALVTNLVRFCGRPRFSSLEPEPERDNSSIDKSHEGQAVSGGYNDAFIIQFWTSYNPR